MLLDMCWTGSSTNNVSIGWMHALCGLLSVIVGFYWNPGAISGWCVRDTNQKWFVLRNHSATNVVVIAHTPRSNSER